MFFKSWGENITSGMGIGLVTGFFVIVVALLSFVITVALGQLWIVGVIIGAVGISLVIACGNAAEQVAVTALYLYSKNGQMPQIYQELGMTQFHMGPVNA